MFYIDTTVRSNTLRHLYISICFQEKRMVVFVEAAVMEDAQLDQYKPFLKIKDKLMTFRDGKDDLTDKIDFIICLGGDGTLLYASQLFQQSVPPVMAFHLGSLGFLTPFQFHNFQEQVNNVLEGKREFEEYVRAEPDSITGTGISRKVLEMLRYKQILNEEGWVKFKVYQENAEYIIWIPFIQKVKIVPF